MTPDILLTKPLKDKVKFMNQHIEFMCIYRNELPLRQVNVALIDQELSAFDNHLVLDEGDLEWLGIPAVLPEWNSLTCYGKGTNDDYESVVVITPNRSLLLRKPVGWDVNSLTQHMTDGINVSRKIRSINQIEDREEFYEFRIVSIIDLDEFEGSGFERLVKAYHAFSANVEPRLFIESIDRESGLSISTDLRFNTNVESWSCRLCLKWRGPGEQNDDSGFLGPRSALEVFRSAKEISLLLDNTKAGGLLE